MTVFEEKCAGRGGTFDKITSSAFYSDDENETSKTKTTTEIASASCAHNDHAADNNVNGASFDQLQSSARTDLHIAKIDDLIRGVAFYAFGVYMILVGLSYHVGTFGIFPGIAAGDRIHMERLSGVERTAPMLAAVLLGTSICTSFIPLTYRKKKGDRMLTGIMIAGFVVQFVAFTTNILLCTVPVPVIIDPMTGMRVFLLRWSEWAPLAFVMTFITEVCRVKSDNNNNNMMNHHWAYWLALCQGLSAFCGWLFPFITNFTLWVATMVISCLLFIVIYYRLYIRWMSYRKMKNVGSSLTEREMHQCARLSLGLLTTCAVLWTFLVLAFSVYSFGPMLFPENQLLKTRGMVMCCECFIDVLFKNLYLIIIVDIHNAIFDPNARANRRLEEMRLMMNTVWRNSSDVIALSTRKLTGDVVTLFSPTFLKVLLENGHDGSSTKINANNSVGAAIELDAKYFSSSDKNNNKNKSSLNNDPSNGSIQPSSIYEVEFGSKPSSTEGDYLGNVPPTMKKRNNTSDDELQPVLELVVKAWRQPYKHGGESQSILHNFIVWSSNKNNNSIKDTITCEANITRLEENALVIVVRNVTERFRRFEAEKRAVAETTARMKDAAANRFTKHEVKNGLLAAIGLCDSLKESFSGDNRNSLVTEMDKTLHEILDTVLSETMSRDVIHDVYEPRLERTNIVQLIQSTMNDTTGSDRFPLRTSPRAFPPVSTDPQLLKYIHRNAMSNACKYGEKGGTVLTKIKLDEISGNLCIKVINSPGMNHDEILKLGNKAASDIVFSPSKHLPMHTKHFQKSNISHSSGDGAWLMLKCANTLGGNCNIEFLEDKTVFTFRMTTTPLNEISSNNSRNDKKEFKLPSNLHAIALDDSKIQRKLLARYFTYAGLSKDKVTILGDTVKNITEFENSTRTFIENHPDDYILLIVDENLDVYEDLQTSTATISGSMHVHNIRRKLLPHDERRVLALIRSANDSADDVAKYNSRAHGWLPKSPIKQDKVLEELASHWLARFSLSDTPSFTKGKFGTQEVTSGTLSEEEHDELAWATDYLEESITSINELMSLNDEVALFNNWLTINEKLLCLKGDLLTLSSNPHDMSIAIHMINDMRVPKVPPNATEKWEHLKSIISCYVDFLNTDVE